jgi:hypothetical protein
MTIELGVSRRALFDLFDSERVMSEMSREIPGVGTIQLGTMIERRGGVAPIQATAFVPILITFGTGVVSAVTVKLLSDFLVAKLKGEDKARRMMTVNREIVEVTTSEAMVKILTEDIRIEDEQK